MSIARIGKEGGGCLSVYTKCGVPENVLLIRK